MGGKPGYAVLEVGGIQNFILGTGKLKEMLGGSELIESLSKSVLADFCAANGLELLDPARPVAPEGRQVLPLQRNAGAMHLLFASEDQARDFAREFSLHVLEKWPGVPLFGAVGSTEWTKDGLDKCRRELAYAINLQRAAAPAAQGMGLLPLCQTARLDGLPAVARDGDEEISLPSRTRRQPELLAKARERLRDGLPESLPESSLPRSEDLEELSAGMGKIALIHMDGNDLGLTFGNALKKLSEQHGLTAADFVSNMHDLSQTVEKSTSVAFARAMGRIVDFALVDWKRKGKRSQDFVIPARPLVLGGDDVTVVVRVDLALLFIDTFVREFERETGDKQLSVGVGMVVCPTGYPFLKAFTLAEDLLKSAKKLTAEDKCGKPRPSSLDYVVLTNDAENSLDELRRHTATTADGKAMLTAKPFLLRKNDLRSFVHCGIEVLEKLPRSATRPAMNECRASEAAASKQWKQLHKNIQRGLGGRHNSELMPEDEFLTLFPDGFFADINGKRCTRLGDWLELAHLLPEDRKSRAEYLSHFGEQGGKHA